RRARIRKKKKVTLRSDRRSADCQTASPSAIDKFNGCSNDSICDPSCRDLISPPPASGSTSTGGGGASASDCQTACNKLITQCNFAPVGELNDCVSQCQSQGYQYQIDCVNNNSCSDIKARCGSTGSSSTGTTDAGISFDSSVPDPDVLRCQDDCQQLNSMSCLEGSDFTTCDNACTTNSAGRSTFESCVESSVDCTAGTGCFTSFTQ
ncbi:MAG: hypothetical protein ABI183_11960, partial [Polyangiaceae bacterium]